MSRSSATSVAEVLGVGLLVLEAGAIRFRRRQYRLSPLSLGLVVIAWKSKGIPNIALFVHMKGTAPSVDVPRCRTDRRQQNASRVLSYDAMRFFDEGRRTALRWGTKAVINGAHAEKARQARLSWTCWAYSLDSKPTSGVSVSLRASPPRRRAASITGANLRSIPPRYSARAPRRNRALQTFQKPHFAHRADHGKPKMSPQAELERYCELIAALKLRTTNKAGRRRSTGRAKHGRFRTRAVTPGTP